MKKNLENCYHHDYYPVSCYALRLDVLQRAFQDECPCNPQTGDRIYFIYFSIIFPHLDIWFQHLLEDLSNQIGRWEKWVIHHSNAILSSVSTLSKCCSVYSDEKEQSKVYSFFHFFTVERHPSYNMQYLKKKNEWVFWMGSDVIYPFFCIPCNFTRQWQVWLHSKFYIYLQLIDM